MTNRLTIILWFALVFGVTFSRAGEIHSAAKEGDLSRLKELLASDTTLIDSKNEKGDTPLHEAVRSGNQKAVDFLLTYKPDLQQTNRSGLTPLKLAKGYGRNEIVESLVKAGAGIAPENKETVATSNLPPANSVVEVPGDTSVFKSDIMADGVSVADAISFLREKMSIRVG